MTIGSTITLKHLHDSPYLLLQQLLAHEPVSWVPELNMWPNAVEEVLRWEAPVQTAYRVVRVDTAVSDIPLRAGQMVQCMLSAANRDPRLFAQPDRFDIDRANAAKHLSFARGPHFCFGAPLARLEATIGLPILLARLPHLRLCDPATSRPVGHEFRGPPSLWAEWDERKT